MIRCISFNLLFSNFSLPFHPQLDGELVGNYFRIWNLFLLFQIELGKKNTILEMMVTNVFEHKMHQNEAKGYKMPQECLPALWASTLRVARNPSNPSNPQEFTRERSCGTKTMRWSMSLRQMTEWAVEELLGFWKLMARLDGESKSQGQPPGMVWNPENNRINYQPQLVSEASIVVILIKPCKSWAILHISWFLPEFFSPSTEPQWKLQASLSGWWNSPWIMILRLRQIPWSL